MAKCVDYLAELYRGIHVGRADPDLLSSIKISVDGQHYSLPHVSLITTVGTTLIKVQPYDREWLVATERAINDSKLGVTTARTPDTVLVKLPSLTGDRRQELFKVAKELAEKQRIAVRNLRRDARKISRDHDSIESATKAVLSEIDELLESKRQQLLPKSLFS